MRIRKRTRHRRTYGTRVRRARTVAVKRCITDDASAHALSVDNASLRGSAGGALAVRVKRCTSDDVRRTPRPWAMIRSAGQANTHSHALPVLLQHHWC
jgi:hypothetical protein